MNVVGAIWLAEARDIPNFVKNSLIAVTLENTVSVKHC
jgi:hypothetical protein